MNNSVLYQVDGAIATITLNRPESRNAIDESLVLGLMDAVAQVREDESVRAMILTGADKGFCAGADLSTIEGAAPEDVRNYLVDRYLPMIMALATLPKPVVAAVNGVAAGAGASIALACDLRVMAEDGSLLQAFSNIGLVPDGGSTWFLVRMVGYGRAFEIAAEGERIPARRCLEIGLVNQIVPVGQLMEAALARAAKLANRPTLALGLTKQALYRALQIGLDEAIRYEADLQQQAVASTDHREGVAAFREKRPPHWTGK